MDQNQAPLVDALAMVERRPVTGFGASGHSAGKAIPTSMRRLLGKRVSGCARATVRHRKIQQ